jgi:hypothetical protein
MRKTILTAIAALMMSSTAQAVPTLFNGHYYEFVQLTADISWTDARAAAQAKTHMGEQGYLVNITSAAEQNFVINLTPGVWVPGNPLVNDGWIGASDKDTEGEWKWVDGPEGGETFWSGISTGSLVAPFTYENWGSMVTGDGDEPNDQGGEDHAHLQGSFGWNDLPNISKTPRRGYFIEYGSTRTDSFPIAEPTTFAILGLGLAGLGVMRRRRKV